VCGAGTCLASPPGLLVLCAYSLGISAAVGRGNREQSAVDSEVIHRGGDKEIIKE
jgi:hypothetical protein